MGSLGGHLRELRTARGVSLDDIARATRVTKGYLEALEEERTGDLPAPVFARGFLRAYCQFLQVPADEALAEYDRLAAGAVAPPGAAPVRGRRPARLGGSLVMSLVLLVVLGVALVGVTLWLRGDPGKKAPPGVVAGPAAPTRAGDSTPFPAAREVPPTAAEATTPGPAQPPPAPARGTEERRPGQHLLVRAVELTWVRLQLDDGPAVEELLQAGAVREWTASRRFVLTVGNAGGIELELNGQRLAPLGNRGAVVRELMLPAEAAPRS